VTAIPPSPARSPRRAFALTGPSAVLDPSTHAVRPDLADVRLAEQVFAPHYAQAVPCVLGAVTELSAERGGPAVATLDAGETFEVLDLVGDHGWGIAPARRLVGYVARDALGWA